MCRIAATNPRFLKACPPCSLPSAPPFLLFGRLAQLVRALALHARGHRFESCAAHQFLHTMFPLVSLSHCALPFSSIPPEPSHVHAAPRRGGRGVAGRLCRDCDRWGGCFGIGFVAGLAHFSYKSKMFLAEGQQPPAVGGRIRTILETDCAGDVRLGARVGAMCCSRSLHACSMRGG